MSSISAEKIVDVFRICAKSPSITRATIRNACAGILNIAVEWTQRDLELFENTKSQTTFIVSSDTLETVDHCPATAISSECLSSFNGFCRAVVRKCISAKGDEKQMLEVWRNCIKIINIDILAKECHGKIYEDDQFGCLRWSNDGNYIVYVAEKKRAKTESFFKIRSSNLGNGDDTNHKGTVIPGEEFKFREDWGEKLLGKCCPVPCILNVNTGEINVVNNLPEDISFGQPVWTPDDKGLVVVGWSNEPRRLGLTFCTNRQSALYHIQFENSSCTALIGVDSSVRSPRFSPDGKQLVYLSNGVGGPHHRGSQLILMHWPEQTTEVIVDLVQNDTGNNFPGLYLLNFPERIWLDDNKTIIIQSHWRCADALLRININSKAVERLDQDNKIESAILLDVWNDFIIASFSSPNMQECLRICNVTSSTNLSEIQWHNISEETVENGMKWKIISLSLPESMINKEYPADRIEVILVEPQSENHEKFPLILLPHGGPHSAFTISYKVPVTAFIKLGYALVMVNFRGSSGYGEMNLNSLPGNVGTQDVSDCKYVLDYLLMHEGYDKNKVVVYGGSHGGFLSTHLIGQYPDAFKACVCRNPVTELISMSDISDIPDWGWVESGFQYDHDHDYNLDVLKAMWEKSPMRYVHQVRTPTLLLMGKQDVRVPPSQSMIYYHALKGKHVKGMNIYDDGHSLAKVEVEADAFVHTVLWFDKYLSKPLTQLPV